MTTNGSTGKGRWLGGARARRMGVSVADQAVTSIGNLLLTVLAARALSIDDFGAFSLVYTIGLLVLGVSRALVTEPLLVTFSHRHEGEAIAAAPRSVGASLVVGVALAVPLALVASTFEGSLRNAGLLLALGLPVLMVHDAWRYVALTLARPAMALTNDVVWVTVMLTTLVALRSAGTDGVVAVMVAWVAAAAVGSVLGGVLLRQRVAVRAGPGWIRENLGLGGRFCLDYLTAGGTGYVTLLVLAAVAGLEATGAVRGVQTMFGPVSVAFAGAMVVVVPEGVRLAAQGRRRLDRLVTACAVVLTGGAAVWLALVAALPDDMGTALLGDTWSDSQALLPWMAAGLAAGGAAGAAFIGLRCLADAKGALRTRLATMPILIALPALGAVLDGAKGFALGFSVSGVVAAAAWWWQFRRGQRSTPGPTTPAPGPTPWPDGVTAADRAP